MRRRLALAVAIMASFVLSGCAAATIVPPAAVSHPSRAAVLDHGRHSSLLLERRDGSVVRYAYGEWEWYAAGRTGPGRALGALFWPSEGALGRRILPGPLAPEAARRQVREGFEEILVFEVEASRAEGLDRRLDAAFRSGEARLIRNPDFDLEFVPVDASYWIGRNSNLVMAEWLEELGCRVDDPGVLSAWRLGR